MLAREIMQRDVIGVGPDEPVERVFDLFARRHVHGVPVVDEHDRLIGIVTHQDVYFGSMTRCPSSSQGLRVSDIMTSPAISAEETVDVIELCRLMTRLRIQRVPIVRKGKLTGMVSSMDLCRAVSGGLIRPADRPRLVVRSSG